LGGGVGGFLDIISSIAEEICAEGEMNVDRSVSFFQLLILVCQTATSVLKIKIPVF